MAFANVDGSDLYYEEKGAGAPILLIHPAGATASTWGSVVDDLARVGRVTISLPILCTRGARSADTMVRITRSLAGAIPSARVREIPGAGHAVAFDAPAEFVKVILDATR